jgi:hypothetical protein
MPTLNSVIAEEFCKHVQWAYELWQTATTLLSLGAVEATRNSQNKYFFYRLHVMVEEGFLLEIAKFHDRAIQNDRTNLTLEYILEYGEWDDSTRKTLKDLRDKLDGFNALLRPARNRIFAHKDLQTILEERTLGGFPTGADSDYFENLKAFAFTVQKSVTGKLWAWSEDGKIDAEIFLDDLVDAKLLPALR